MARVKAVVLNKQARAWCLVLCKDKAGLYKQGLGACLMLCGGAKQGG